MEENSIDIIKKLKIAIVLSESYPYGMACSNRIHAYAKSLRSLGHDTFVLVPKTKNTPQKNRVSGKYGAQSFEKIRYYYSTGTNIRKKGTVQRLIDDIIGPLKSFRILNKENGIDIILLVSNSFFHINLFKLFSIVLGTLYIQEKSELPPSVRRKNQSLLNKIFGKFYISVAYKLFDGLIVISNYLEEYFKNKMKKNSSILQIPIIVNDDEFKDKQKERSEDTKNIVYAGSLCQQKDGILGLIDAFCLVRKKVSNSKLILIGNIDKSPEKTKIYAKIEENNIQENVEITGFLSREEVINNLINADTLVLNKPKTLQNEYCFPTKLGEYLITGNPVVTTRVGEIPLYLEDSHNAYMAEPGNTSFFANKILEAISNPKASEVGTNGKKTALAKFDYLEAGRNLEKYFYQLLKRKNGSK